MSELEIMLNGGLNWLKTFGPKLISAIIVFIIGWALTKTLIKLLDVALKKTKINITLHVFIESLTKGGLLILLTISCVDILGVPTTSFVTILGTLGIGISLAVKDSLANLSGGVLILLTRPFLVGNFVEVNGVNGTVAQIGLIYTQLTTIDNKHIYIPNGEVVASKITNFSAEEQRRLDLKFSISYNDDFEKAKQIITDIVTNHELSHTDKDIVVRINEFADSAIIIVCRVWVDASNYWSLNFDILEQVKTAFDKEKITIPYKQLDVHVVN